MPSHVRLPALALAALVTLSNTGAFADEPEASPDQIYDLARAMSRCAGFYEAMSQALSVSDPATAQHAHGLANGAKTATLMLAKAVISGEDAVEFTANMAEAETTRWRSKVQEVLDLGRPDALALGALCVELNPLQTELVEQSDKEIYGFR